MGQSDRTEFDVIINGGGPLACAIARDAVGRGLRVILSSTDDFGVDIRQHIAACGMSILSNKNNEINDEIDVLERVCPQIKTDMPNPTYTRKKRLFAARQTPEETNILPSAELSNRFALLNARDAAERGAKLFPHSELNVEPTAQGNWQVRVMDQSNATLLSTVVRVYIDTQADIDTLPPKTARVASFAKNETFSKCAYEHSDTVKFAFETADSTISVGIIGPNDISAQDVLELARKQGIHGPPMWMSQSFTPCTRPAEFSIDPAPARFTIPDNAHSGWRALAENVVAEMAPFAQMIGKKWTAFTKLPGGDFEPGLRPVLLSDLQETHPNIDTAAMARMFGNYGTECAQILGEKGEVGQHFGAGLFEAEVKWLMDQEWAQSATDVLWRRTLLGKVFTNEQAEHLNAWMSQYAPNSRKLT